MGVRYSINTNNHIMIFFSQEKKEEENTWFGAFTKMVNALYQLDVDHTGENLILSYLVIKKSFLCPMKNLPLSAIKGA